MSNDGREVVIPLPRGFRMPTPMPTDHEHFTAERIIELYREQIAYLLSELHRIGWTQYPEDSK